MRTHPMSKLFSFTNSHFTLFQHPLHLRRHPSMAEWPFSLDYWSACTAIPLFTSYSFLLLFQYSISNKSTLKHPGPSLTQNGSRSPFTIEGLEDRHLLQCSTLLFGSCYGEDTTDTLPCFIRYSPPYKTSGQTYPNIIVLQKFLCLTCIQKSKGLKCNYVFLDHYC